MKKAVILLLILSLCLGLCACGEPVIVEKEVEVPTVPEKWLRYQDLFDALEARDYFRVISLFDDMVPLSDGAPVKEVIITTENFLDYFEYVEFPEYGSDITVYSVTHEFIGISFYPGYFLKEGFTVPEEYEDECKVEVGVKWNDRWFDENEGIEVDPVNRTYTITGEPSETDAYDEMLLGESYQLVEFGPWFYYIPLSEDGTYLSTGSENDATNVFTDVEFVSASGVLYLYE